MSIAITHTAACDVAGCINEGIAVDVMTITGQPPCVYCGGCSSNISHTCTPKE